MFNKENKLKEFNFADPIKTGLLITAGGFEHRALTFVEKIKNNKNIIENSLIFKYESKYIDNDNNFKKLYNNLLKITGKKPEIVDVDLDHPLESCENIKNIIFEKGLNLTQKDVFVDISAMTHLYTTMTIHSCISSTLKTHVIFTEAYTYFPPKHEKGKILQSWRNQDYKIAANYLQSKGLKDVIIHPDFQGNFRPGKKICLSIFVGYEPNRIEGLIDIYAPSRLIIYYGVSPHEEMKWRTKFSKDLHKNLFSHWYVHESDVSTLEINEIFEKIENDFTIIQEKYDIAIAPQNSKIQSVVSYLFWREHPEIQLLFTTPVMFRPDRYSKGSRRTFNFDI